MREVRKVVSVVGARPNFMKTAPVIAALRDRPEGIEHALVHTGQHYDDAMSAVFLEQLGVGTPEHMLGVGSGSHAQQTARVMERVEEVLVAERPDLVLVPGDINSTLAATLVAAKLDIPVGHIEGGLRSFDRTMPEELNRIVTDALSSMVFTHSPEARENLLREGCERHRIHEVGNTMIDSLVAMRDRIEAAGAPERYGVTRGEYLVVTLHRPALVDGPLLVEALEAIERVARDLPVVFPMHPRTAGAMERAGFRFSEPGVLTLEPIGYLEFLSLVASAAGVLTDSGGIQEETTYLGIPCYTLRDNTERPVTCTQGTNRLLGLSPARIAEVPQLLADDRGRDATVPAGWDGRAAQRIAAAVAAGVPEWTSPTQGLGRA
jgi:UDP-N-acetylglucosamine 2-epimerase (non-hydrolysing)